MDPLFLITNHSYDSIIAMLSHSADNIDFNNNEMVCHYYDSLIRLRHDSLHYAVSMALYNCYTPEKRIDEIFPTYNGNNNGLTPDIIYTDAWNVYLIDVSFTKNASEAYHKKKNKYELVSIELQQLLKKNVEVVPFCIDPKLDIKLAKKKLNQKFKYKFNERFIRDMYDLYMQKIMFINNHGKASLIRDYSQMTYSDVPIVGLEDDFEMEECFLDDIIKEKYNYDLNTIIDIDQILPFIKEDLDNEGSLYMKFIDKKNSVDQYKLAYDNIINKNNEYECDIKPTIHCLFPEKEDILPIIIGNNSEQLMINQFFNHINDNLLDFNETHTGFLKILAEFHIKMTENTNYQNCFNNSVYFSPEEETKNREEYNHYRSKLYDGKRKKTSAHTKSYYDYLVEEGKLKESPYYSTMAKTICFNKGLIGAAFKEYWKKSGTQWHKNHPEKVYKPQTTVSLDDYHVFDDFVSYLCEKKTGYYDKTFTQMADFVKYTKMSDSNFCKRLKEIAWDEMEPWYDLLTSSKAHEFGYFNHLFYSQIMHYSTLSTNPNVLHIFNCGIPNFLGVMVGGYNSLTDESGKPFFSMIITKNPDIYTNIYGSLYKIKLKNNNWLIMTKWRRLPVMKCTYLRDSYYSSFTSGLNYCSYTEIRGDIRERFSRCLNQYVIKTITSHCTTQQVAEFLLDSRFALMSSFSQYTNIYKLLAEKFAPPYTNIMSVWIVNRLFTRLREITTAMLSENETVMFKKVDFNLMGRSRDSIGGYINIPSLWTDYTLYNIHEVLDEAFLYVHTMKEPSSMFHEQIKAVKTIIDFQEEFDNTIEDYKRGNVNDSNVIKDFLLSNGNIGFSAGIIKTSTEHTLGIIKPNYKKIQNEVLTEPLSNIVSTKAIIHSLDREVQEEKMSINYIKKAKKLLKFLNKEDEPAKRFILKTKSKFYKTKTRQKVWETIIELLEKYPDEDTVNKMACKLLLEQRATVEADICIKSQYGAKREFYVVNVGAKLLARQVEKTFELISKVTPEEAISIPGDEKMIAMQRMLDNSTQLARSGGYKLIYVNGDCTKWSAAETMGSFLAMMEGFNGKFTDKFNKLLKTTFAAWADKTINIPISIYNKVYPSIKTEYLEKLIKQKSKGVHSTHNFLQGMFNYASSFKSVCCTNFSYHCWLKMYPKSKLKVTHMEHSDDYIMIILYKNEEELVKYRAFHKMMMKLHGFNDSERKTSCQTLFMEFVSVMSFNGEMLYPQIKKAKEINLNLPCLGYPTDSEAATSRMGECVRVGCNLSFSYIFGKIHNYCLAEAYSLLPNMINWFTNDIKELFERPIEIFGIPDQYPLFSLLCKGSINNYRLYKYGNDLTKKIINGLYVLNQKIPNELDQLTENNPEFSKCLYSPRFLYEMENNQIKFIRKNIGIQPDKLKEYWEEYKVFRFIKPTKNKYLSTWMQAMFYNRLFSEAYTAVSRTRMTMRISRYVKSKTMVMTITGEVLINENQIKDKKLDKLTLKESYNNLILELGKLEENEVDEKEIHQILVKCDANVTAVYSYFEKTNILILKEKFDKLRLRANRTPHKITWFSIENNIGVVLMKLVSPEIFLEENRYYLSDRSLQRDVETIERELLTKPANQLSIMELQFLFNQLTLNKSKQVTMLGFTGLNVSFNDFITGMLENSVYFDHTATITTAGITEIQNPFTTATFFMKQKKGTKNLLGQGLETLVLLYTYLKVTLRYSDELIKEIIEELNFCMNPIKNEYVKYRDLLSKINTQTKENLQLNVRDMKCAAYLQSVLMDNSTLLTELTNNIYMYGYKYYSKANYNAGKWEGNTECAFNYLNNKFYLIQKDDKNPILFTVTKNHQINCAAYLVALRLAGKITNNEFELHKYDHTLNSYMIMKKHIPQPYVAQQKKKITHLYTNKWYGFNEIKEDDFILPILKIYGSMPLTEQNFNVTQKYIPKITDEILMVSLGRMKLFTLPFWECDQYDCVESENNRFIGGVPINTLLRNRLIHKQLNGSNIPGIKGWDHCELNSDDYMELLKNTNQNIVIELETHIKGMEDFFKKEKQTIVEDYVSEMIDDNIVNYNSESSEENIPFDFSDWGTNSDDDTEPFDIHSLMGDVTAFDPINMENKIKEEKQLVNLKEMAKQEDELFTEVGEFNFYEEKEELNLEDPDAAIDEYWDATKGINFEGIVLVETKRSFTKTNIGGMIMKMATMEPIINHYFRMAYHIRLPRYGFLNGLKYIITINDLVCKINNEKDDFLKTTLLYEFYYLIKYITIRNSDIENNIARMEIKNGKPEYFYHYSCKENDPNYKKLKLKYESLIDQTGTDVFIIPVDLTQLRKILKNMIPRPYEFNRSLFYKSQLQSIDFDINEFL